MRGIYPDEGSVILQTWVVRVVHQGRGIGDGLGGRLGTLGLKEIRKLAKRVQGGVWSMTATDRNSPSLLSIS